MSGPGVPDEDYPLAVNEAFELPEEIDKAGRVEAIFLGAGKQASFLAIPAKPQRRGYRRLIPVVAARL